LWDVIQKHCHYHATLQISSSSHKKWKPTKITKKWTPLETSILCHGKLHLMPLNRDSGGLVFLLDKNGSTLSSREPSSPNLSISVWYRKEKPYFQHPSHQPKWIFSAQRKLGKKHVSVAKVDRLWWQWCEIIIIITNWLEGVANFAFPSPSFQVCSSFEIMLKSSRDGHISRCLSRWVGCTLDSSLLLNKTSTLLHITSL
jgi:hypothetical protein